MKQILQLNPLRITVCRGIWFTNVMSDNYLQTWRSFKFWK